MKTSIIWSFSNFPISPSTLSQLYLWCNRTAILVLLTYHCISVFLQRVWYSAFYSLLWLCSFFCNGIDMWLKVIISQYVHILASETWHFESRAYVSFCWVYIYSFLVTFEEKTLLKQNNLALRNSVLAILCNANSHTLMTEWTEDLSTSTMKPKCSLSNVVRL